MSRAVVLAAGNPLMRDDAIGACIARALEPVFLNLDIEVFIGETDVSCCLDYVCPDDFLIILDAMYMGEQPGTVCKIPLYAAFNCRKKSLFAHETDVVDTLAEWMPGIQGYLIGIEPAEICVGLGLSYCLKNKFTQVCADAEDLIRSIIDKYANTQSV